MHPIGQAAKQSGVNIETIRYYEREGVVPAPQRSGSGRRLYDDAAISRLRFIRRCRDLGFPISDIRILLELSNNADKSCDDVRTISERHLMDVRSRLKDLGKLEVALSGLIQECMKPQPGCPALKTLFADG